jgi:cell wall-associated NlpC family hydrolase
VTAVPTAIAIAATLAPANSTSSLADATTGSLPKLSEHPTGPVTIPSLALSDDVARNEARQAVHYHHFSSQVAAAEHQAHTEHTARLEAETAVMPAVTTAKPSYTPASAPAPVTPAAPVTTTATQTPAATSVNSSGQSFSQMLLAKAETQAGTPYVWGGAAPGGFDCSGLIYWAAMALGVQNMPRDTYSMLAAAGGLLVQTDTPEPGDLAFFGSEHVELYVSPGVFFGAQQTGTLVGFHDYGTGYVPTAYYYVS